MESVPHDIAAIPYFPPAPGLFEWVLFVLASLVLFLVATWRPAGSFAADPSGRALKRLRELKGRLANMPDQDRADVPYELSLILRRLIEAREKIPAGELSMSEIRQSLGDSKNSGMEHLLALLSRIEQLKYKGHSPDVITIDGLLSEVRRTVESSAHG